MVGKSFYQMKFQLALPRRERLKRINSLLVELKFQLALPRRERQLPGGILSPATEVSTRAPAKGATRLQAD